MIYFVLFNESYTKYIVIVISSNNPITSTYYEANKRSSDQDIIVERQTHT